MNRDTKLQIKTMVYFTAVVAGIVTMHMWPETEAGLDDCGGVHYVHEYNPHDYSSIAHLADLNDKMSDDAERGAIFDPVESYALDSIVWIKPNGNGLQNGITRNPRHNDDHPVFGDFWPGGKPVVVPPRDCGNKVSEPSILFLMIAGLFLMFFRGRK